jgi:membrane metallo-endopeptidase-like protein 1
MQLALPSRDYYLKKSSDVQLLAYHRYMTSVAVLLGADPKNASEEFEKVIALEKELASVRLKKYYFIIRSYSFSTFPL